jgi:hypothetical protein
MTNAEKYGVSLDFWIEAFTEFCRARTCDGCHLYGSDENCCEIAWLKSESDTVPEYSKENQHRDYSHDDWVNAVLERETCLGYNDWVLFNLKEDQ